MITRCPNCGQGLERPIKCGIKSCTRCRAFFEADMINTLLSASWELRKNPHMGYDQFQFNTQLSDEDAKFVYYHVAEECCCHDDFIRLLKKNEVAAIC